MASTPSQQQQSYDCIILGAGPAGMGAAIALVEHGVTDILIVDRNRLIGGLARTEMFDGNRFDIGPHRFFTKNREINALWNKTLGDDFRPVDRLTRIYYNHQFFHYPIKAFETFWKLGLAESAHAFVSFLYEKMVHQTEAQTFEDWIVQKFGSKLYQTFFKTYTEKVWGIPCNQIGAEWAAQRIKGLDITQILKNAVFGDPQQEIKTLVDRFDYPLYGAGQMYEAMMDSVVNRGGSVMLNSRVTTFHRKDHDIAAITVTDGEGHTYHMTANHYFNSIPLTHFFQLVIPEESADVQQAASTLYYREHITVNLVINGNQLFPDQWIYIHAPDVKMARLANYNNFSPAMVKDPAQSALSVEYFTFKHEGLWQMTDEDLKQLAIDELSYLRLVEKGMVQQAWVVRETESYPTYFLGYQESYGKLKGAMDRYTNITPIGRGGMYKYNNQDHSTLSGILAVRNYLNLPGAPYNLWEINTDAAYHESASRGN
jgi:protoporphyrinogen oxidase